MRTLSCVIAITVPFAPVTYLQELELEVRARKLTVHGREQRRGR
jgi:hypothetical protein